MLIQDYLKFTGPKVCYSSNRFPCREPLAKSCIQSEGEEDRQTHMQWRAAWAWLGWLAEVICDRTRSKGHKRHKTFHFNVRKNFFMWRLEEHWNRLPGRAWSLLETFQMHVNVPVSPALPAFTGRLETGWSPGMPSNPSESLILWTSALEKSLMVTFYLKLSLLIAFFFSNFII